MCQAADQSIHMVEQSVDLLFRRRTFQLRLEDQCDSFQPYQIPVASQNGTILVQSLEAHGQLGGCQVLQSFAAKLSGLDLVQNITEEFWFLMEQGRQFIERLLDPFGRLPFDDDHQVVGFAETLRILHPSLMKICRRIDQIGSIGFELEKGDADQCRDHYRNGSNANCGPWSFDT